MQLSHATAFWLRLAGNILLDLFLYVHMFCSPFQGRAALTVEVTRPRGRPASRCCVGAFQNSQRLEMCGAPRSGQRGWSTCTPSRVHIPDVLSATLPLQDWGRVARHPGRTQEILSARGLFNESPTYRSVADGSSIGLSPW